MATNTRPVVGACLIVRDEIANLGRCLQSLRRAVDEVVVVDTGSIDGTADLARAQGARVFSLPWTDDFAAARNESLRRANADWLLWIDADEQLVESRPGALRRLCRRLGAELGCQLSCVSLKNAAGDVGTTAQQWRLLRNHQGIAFKGRVHEQLVVPGQDLPAIPVDGSVTITHWGYIPESGLMERKLGRNAHLLALARAEDPDNPSHAFHLGMQHAAARDYAAALTAANEALALWQRQPRASGMAAPMFALAASAALNLGDYQQVLDIEASTPVEFVSSDLTYNAAVACVSLNRTAEALARLHRVLGDRSIARPGLQDVGNSTWRPLGMLANIYQRLGDQAAAHDFVTRALAYEPHEPALLYIMATICAAAGQLEQCASWISSLLSGERDDGYKAHGRDLALSLGMDIADSPSESASRFDS